MVRKPLVACPRSSWPRFVLAALSLALFTQRPAPGESAPPDPEAQTRGQMERRPPDAAQAPFADPMLRQVDCRHCGNGLIGGGFGDPGLCGPHGCGPGQCVPGRVDDYCDGCFGDTYFGRVFGKLYNCVCCPDPCYRPRWVAAANAAFFADAARPVTQMRLRWDAGYGLRNPDRAEYFWAAVQRPRNPQTNNELTLNQSPNSRMASPKGPGILPNSIDYGEFTLYTEGATERIGVFVEMPYRHWEDDQGSGFSGFGDINIGTKSLLLDCEIAQVAFQFRTYIPSGLSGKGLGTGHVSLEPSLLWAVKLTPDTYFQAQTAYWIPISADPHYAGDIFHYHLSFNHVLCRPMTGVEVIGTAELNGWSVLDGAFSDPASINATANTYQAPSARAHLMSAGPGVRLVICDKIDFGVGAAFGVNSNRWTDQLYRAEFRWRF